MAPARHSGNRNAAHLCALLISIFLFPILAIFFTSNPVHALAAQVQVSPGTAGTASQYVIRFTPPNGGPQTVTLTFRVLNGAYTTVPGGLNATQTVGGAAPAGYSLQQGSSTRDGWSLSGSSDNRLVLQGASGGSYFLFSGQEVTLTIPVSAGLVNPGTAGQYSVEVYASGESDTFIGSYTISAAASNTPTPTSTSTIAPTHTETPTPSPTLAPSLTPTATSSPTPSPTPEPSLTPTDTPTPTETATPTPTPTATRAPGITSVSVSPDTAGASALHRIAWIPDVGTGSSVRVELQFRPNAGSDRTLVPTDLTAGPSTTGFSITQGGATVPGWTLAALDASRIAISNLRIFANGQEVTVTIPASAGLSNPVSGGGTYHVAVYADNDSFGTGGSYTIQPAPPTATPTPTPNPTATQTATNTPIPTDTPSATPTETATPTATPTLTATSVPTLTSTLSPTATGTSTPTVIPTLTPSATTTPTETPTTTPTSTPEPAPPGQVTVHLALHRAAPRPHQSYVLDVHLGIHMVNTVGAHWSVAGRTDTHGAVVFTLPNGLDGQYDLTLGPGPREAALLPISWKRVTLRPSQLHVLPTPNVLEGDTDLDGVIGPRDFSNFREDFAIAFARPAGQGPARSDFDHDGNITVRDFSIFRMGYQP